MNLGYVESFQFSMAKPLAISDEPLTISNNLHLICKESAVTTAYCLDDFESSLRTSHRLLIRQQNTLLLFQANSSTVAKQKCPAKWRFHTELEDGPVKSAIQDCSPIRAILPGSKNTLNTQYFLVLDDNGKTNARFTLYQFTAVKQSFTLGVTQPLRGFASEHDLLQKYLNEQGAKVIKSYDQLFKQCGFDQSVYNAKPTLDIAVNDPIIETANHLITVFMDVARQNEAGLKVDDDTEFLHDYRVSLRKVRSVLSLFKGVYGESENSALKQDFSGIMKATNRLRDLDVYLLDKSVFFDLLSPRMHTGLEQMFDAFAIERKKQLKLVSKKLNSKDYEHTMQTLKDKFSSVGNLPIGPKAFTPSLSFATKLIWKRYKKVCEIARQINAETPDEEVHELRIQCKKLRYLMEFFSSLFPREMLKELIQSLKRLQNNLGLFNDYSVQQVSLEEFLITYAQTHPNKHLIAMAESIGALIVLLEQKQLAERAKVMQSFAVFDSPETRKEFSEIFHHGISQ